MHTSIVLTVICDDRPGIVETLAGVIKEHSGNWTESSMQSLAGKFAGILSVSIPEGEVAGFMQALDELEREGFQIVAHQTAQPASDDDSRELVLDLVGQDHPGIVHQLTEVFANNGINVLELESRCESASMSGETLFIAHARVLLPGDLSLHALQDQIEDLANELMVDINLND